MDSDPDLQSLKEALSQAEWAKLEYQRRVDIVRTHEDKRNSIMLLVADKVVLALFLIFVTYQVGKKVDEVRDAVRREADLRKFTMEKAESAHKAAQSMITAARIVCDKTLLGHTFTSDEQSTTETAFVSMADQFEEAKDFLDQPLVEALNAFSNLQFVYLTACKDKGKHEMADRKACELKAEIHARIRSLALGTDPTDKVIGEARQRCSGH
jgi:hypothetical protein